MSKNRQQATVYFDRDTKEIKREPILGGATLEFLYHSRCGRVLSELVLSRSYFNHLYGWLQRAPFSKRKIPEFVRSLDVRAHEAELPIEAYRSLDHFFTRRLRPEVRPVDPQPKHLLSPADGRALAIANLGEQGLVVKGSRLTLEELLCDRGLAGMFFGGSALVVRLAPADYHRFHFPDGGELSNYGVRGSRLHSVHSIALGAGAPSFRNKRHVSLLETANFGTLGIVEVGALLVGTIVQTHPAGSARRGVEKGYFRFGGSTVVLLAQPGKLHFDADLLAHSEAGIETFVKVGSRIAQSLSV